MKNRLFIFFSLFIIIYTYTFSQSTETEVKYTNQFFAAKTSSGYVYVFIYPDNFTFINVSGSDIQKIELPYSSIGSVKDIFIADDVLFIRLNDNLYYYDLKIILNKNNDGKSFGSIGAGKGQINNISSIYQHENKIYYTKDGNDNLYTFSSKDNKADIPVQNKQNKNIIFKTTKFSRHILHYPLEKTRETEYIAIKGNVDRKITEYNNAVSQIDQQTRDRIETFIGNLSKNDQTFDKAFNSAKSFYLDKIKFDREIFEKFYSLAKLIGGKNTEINNVVGKLRISSNAEIAQRRTNIYNYYAKKAEYDRVNTKEYMDGEKSKITNAIAGIRTGLEGKWGTNFESNQTIINLIFDKDDIKNALRWKTVSNQKDFQTNLQIITNFDNNLTSLFEKTTFTQSNNIYNEYIAVKKFYDDILKSYKENIQNTSYNKDILLTGINNISLHYNMLQMNVAKDYKIKYDNDIKSLTAKNVELSQVEKAVLDLRDTNLTAKKTALDLVINDFSNEYRKIEIIDNINGMNLLFNDYNEDFIDYCLISNEEKIIHGFFVTDSIALDEFNINKNNTGEDYTFIRPSIYSLINKTDDGLFILTSKKTIIAYDTTNPNITKTKIKSLTINEEIFYMIKGGKKQYIVTKDGKLLELSIDRNKMEIKRNDTGKGPITGRDTILITGNDIYVLTTDRVKGSNTINIMPCNSNDEKDILRMTFQNNGMFRINRR